ncbi:MAG: hypothetical protein NVS2B7_25850 [Herpetosiphon sp.]
MTDANLIETLNSAVHRALQNNYHQLNDHDLIVLADELLQTMPMMTAVKVGAAQLLRRYRPSLQRELCNGSAPIPLPAVIEDEVRILTRAIMVSIESQEGISVEACVLLGLVLRAQGLSTLCQSPIE